MKLKVLVFSGSSILLLLLFGFIPVTTTLVPEWRIQVVDRQGKPVTGLIVGEFCTDDTMGADPCRDPADARLRTDDHGFVVFPERRITATLAYRAWRSLVAIRGFVANGDYGTNIGVATSGPPGYGEVRWRAGARLPERLVIPGDAD